LSAKGCSISDLSVWLDRARPETCIPLSFHGNAAAWLHNVTTIKNICKYKKLSKFSEITFLIRERVWQTHFWQQ